jgi:histidinol-phosphate aminotransferase
VIDAVCSNGNQLNRYDGPESVESLRDLIAAYTQTRPDQIVIFLDPSFLLREIVRCFCPTRWIITASSSQVFGESASPSLTEKSVVVRSGPPDFRLDPIAVLDRLRGPCLVIIENPNGLHGRLVLDHDLMIKIVNRRDTLLLVEETFFEFSGMTFAGALDHHGNLALLRTLDIAFGLAGARVGYLLAGHEFLKLLPDCNLRLPRPSLGAAIEAVRGTDRMWKSVQLVTRERERLRRELEIRGATVVPSSANFLLVDTGVAGIADTLRTRRVHVKDVGAEYGTGFIRVSVGTPEENEAFLNIYRDITGGPMAQPAL